MQNSEINSGSLCHHEKNALIFQKVMNYDFSKVERRVIKFQPEIELEKVMPQFRYFLYLAAAVTGKKLPVPNREVDEVWHNAILLTRDYARFCQEVAGRFIHHSPLDAPLTPEQIEERRTQLTNLSIEHFGYMVFDFQPGASCGCGSCDGGTD